MKSQSKKTSSIEMKSIEFVITVFHNIVILRKKLNLFMNMESHISVEIVIIHFHENVILRNILNQFIKMESHISVECVI